MKIKKFQKPALKLDKSQEDVQISPEREAEIRASQQADLDKLWRNRREYEEQRKLEEINKTPEDRYLDFLDKRGLLFLGDSERQAALDKMGFREIPGSDGVPTITQKPEQALQSEDADFAMALAGGLGTKAAAKTVGWLPTIAEEIGAGVVGTGATYGSNYLGQAIDNKYGTNVTPWLTIGSGLAGAFLGGHWGNRGAMKTAKYTIDNGIRGYGDFHPTIQEEILKTPKPNAEPRLNVGWAPRITWKGSTIDDIPVQTDYMQAPPSTPIFNPNGYESKVRNWWFFDKNKTINDDITVSDLRDFVDSRIIRNGNNITVSAADMQLRKNFAEFIDDLTQANTYHPELNVNDIMKEFDLMARRESPMDVDNYSHISDYFTHDAYPRLMNSFKRSGIDLKPEEMDDIYQMYSHPFQGVNISIGYTVPGTGGFSRGPNTIRFSNRYSPTWNDVSDSTIVHELHHSLRNRLGRYLKSKGYDINPGQDWLPEVLESGSASRNNNIRGQYLPSEMEIMKPLAMSKEFIDDKTQIAEIGAVAAGDARWPLWNQKRIEFGRIPSTNELDQYMDVLPASYYYVQAPFLPYGTQIGSAQKNAFNAFEREVNRKAHLTNVIRNAQYDKLPWYKKPFVKKPEFLAPDLYKERLEHINSMGNAWRDAMKYIGGTAGLTVGLNGINAPKKEDKKLY